METNKIGLATLLLTAHCFDILLQKLLQKLESDHPSILNKKITQIYGFANYDPHLPSLKSQLEQLSGLFINGKYIYDKQRELSSGKPFIKVNKPYSYILFEYIGYESLNAFIKDNIKDGAKLKEQLELNDSPKKNQKHYYVSYHFGEYNEIVKSQVTVKDDWKRIEYNYIYPQDNGTFKYFLYFGDIKKRNDAIHIQTRTFLDGKMVPSGENILYVGYGAPSKSKYLLGVFSAFDINNKLIAVKTIHEKCSSKEEMEIRSLEKKVPGYIVQELRNQRLENEIHIPNDKMELSPKSPYYLTYENIAGNYSFQFCPDKSGQSEINITINPDTYKVTSTDQGILINFDDIQLINNASILYLRLNLCGLTPFLQIDIYVKTYYLKGAAEKAKGKYCGIDFENRLVSGDVTFTFISVNDAESELK